MQQLILTGGSGGLGKALSKAFSDSDWQVTAPSHSEMEVTDAQAVANYLKDRPVDLLICCAGITEDSLLFKMKESAWDRVMDVNFQGAAHCAHSVIPAMLKKGRGHLIFISSHSALHPQIGQAAYASAKAALIGLTTSLAEIYGHKNIRVNAILPGYLETDMTASVSTVKRTKILSSHFLGRFNQPATVAKFCRFLHDSLPETSGQVIQLDSRPGF